MAVDETRDKHLAAGLNPFGLGPGESRKVPADGRDTLPGDRDVPPDELSGIDVDDLSARDEQVCGRLAEGDPHEPGGIGHPPCSVGVIRSVQVPRRLHVRSNSA